jgi:hypothetical protein
MQENNDWKTNLVEKHSTLSKIAVETEVSLPTFIRLLNDGYTVAIWKTISPIPCMRCQDLEAQQFNFADFVNSTKYEAPIYSKSHPNCGCVIICTGDGLPSLQVNWTGNVENV